jgi:hypothetical protein
MGALAACYGMELDALIALPASFIGLVTSMEKDFEPFLVPLRTLVAARGPILARRSSSFMETVFQQRAVKSILALHGRPSCCTSIVCSTTDTWYHGGRHLRPLACTDC